MAVHERDGAVVIITIDRPEVANAIDRPAADAVAAAFRRYDADSTLSVTLPEAVSLAREIAAWPQAALGSDRLSSYERWSLGLSGALAGEYRHGMATIALGELFGGLERHASGGWRRGEFS